MAREKITIPEWMKPYLPLLHNTGGNEVGELLNRQVDARSNFVVALLQSCVESQVQLLMSLEKRGLLLHPKD